MKILKDDVVNNVLPIIIKVDIDEYLIPAMCLAKVLEVNSDKIITVSFLIPNININLLVNSKHFRLFMFAMRN